MYKSIHKYVLYVYNLISDFSNSQTDWQLKQTFKQFPSLSQRFTLSAPLFIKSPFSLTHADVPVLSDWPTITLNDATLSETEGKCLYVLCKDWKQFSVCPSMDVPVFMPLSPHWDSHLSSPFPLNDTHRGMCTHAHAHTHNTHTHSVIYN